MNHALKALVGFTLLDLGIIKLLDEMVLLLLHLLYPIYKYLFGLLLLKHSFSVIIHILN